MPKLYTPQTTDYNCTPIAFYNLLKWSASPITKHLTLRKLSGIAQCKPLGTKYEGSLKLAKYIVKHTKLKFIKETSAIESKRCNSFARNIIKMLNNKTAIILDYEVKNGFTHSALLVSACARGWGCYIINGKKECIVEYCNHKELTDLLRNKSIDDDEIPKAWIFRKL